MERIASNSSGQLMGRISADVLELIEQQFKQRMGESGAENDRQLQNLWARYDYYRQQLDRRRQIGSEDFSSMLLRTYRRQAGGGAVASELDSDSSSKERDN